MTEIKQTGSLDLRSAKAAKDTAMENADAINLTPFFSHGPVIGDKYWSSTKDCYIVLEDGWGRYEQTTSSSALAEDIGVLPQPAFEQGVEYTVLLEWRNFTGNGEIHLAPTTAGASNTNRQISISENSFVVSDISETSGSDRRFITCSLNADNADRLLVWRAYTLANSSLSIEIRISIYKGRYYGGYRPYVDQSLIAGYSNLDDKIDSVGSDIHSFCPTAFDIPDTRWYASPNTAAISKLDDTWYHFESDNTSGTSALSYYIVPRNWNLVEPGKPYTILLEMKNFSGVAITEANTLGYMQQYNGAQFWGDATIKSLGRRSHSDESTYIHANDFSDDRSMIFRMIKMSDSEHIGDTAPYNGVCFRYRLYATAGYLTSYDFRISIYPGAYYGDYTPYLTNSMQSIILDVEDNAAPKATAIKRTQRIYYRSNSSTKPTTPGTASSNWVTQSGNVSSAWTTMHVPITNTYKYIYTCEQSETNAGVVSYTTVLRDNTITVIDGGTIITGTIDANKINADSGVFSTANIPELTADHIKANVISAINGGTGQIDADRINAGSLSIGYSQITNPPTIPTQSSIDNAAKTATNYISAGANGIKIANTNPGSASSYQLQTSSSTSFYVNNALKSSIDSNGLYVYDSSSPIASFTADGMTVVGGGATLLADYHSLQLIDRNSTRYLHISDLRDATGHAELTDIFNGNGTTTSFKLNHLTDGTTDSDFEVSVSDSSGGSWSYNSTRNEIQFTSAPTDGSLIYVTYITALSERNLKAYTLGMRKENKTIGPYSYVLGYDNAASGQYSYSEGRGNIASGYASHSEGSGTTASGWGCHAEGTGTSALKSYSHAEGMNSVASSDYGHAEGYQTTASGRFYGSHAEGCITTASGNASHAEGKSTVASGEYSHAEGINTTASGIRSHAEGSGTTASGDYSHAEGNITTASGNASHAMGSNSKAVGNYSLAGGYSSESNGSYSLAFGNTSIARSTSSIALGSNVIANGEGQAAFGRYNVEDTNNDYAFIIGWGSASARKNIFTVDKQGNVSCNSVDFGNTVLLDRSYTTDNSDVSLSSTIGGTKGYSRLLIAAQDSAGNKTTVTLTGPFSNTQYYQVNVTTTGVDASVGLVFRSKTVELRSSTLSVVSSSGHYKYGRATISNNGTVAWSYANEICVTKIIGIV